MRAPTPAPPVSRPRRARPSLLAALALAVALAVGGTACRTTTEVRPEAVPPGPAETRAPGTTATPPTTAPSAPLDVGAAVATSIEQAIGADGLVRWTPGATLTVGTEGAATPRDLEVLATSLQQVGAATGLDLRLVGGGDADIRVLFAPRADWPEELRQVTDHVLGVTRTTWDGGGHLEGARVAVDSSIGQAARNQTILHELVHAVGLGHVECATSVVGGGADAAPRWTLSALDHDVLATWYRPELRTGAPAATVAGALTVVDGGPACEPRVLESAETPEGTIWCEVRPAGASQPCILVDGLGTEPTAPLAAPTRWAVSGVVYDHDPERYEAFTFEGRRLLCERGEGRRPCQFTDGPGPLTAVDAWTDGQVVYDSP